MSAPKRSGHMLAYPLEKKRCEKNGWPLIVQPKLDGDRMSEDIIRHDLRFLISSYENRIYSCPHIEDACNYINFPFPLDGEFYRHGWEHPAIHSAFSRSVDNIHPLILQCKFHVFDVKASDIPQYKRIRLLNELRDKVKHLNLQHIIDVVPSYIVHSWEEIMSAYKKFRDMKYEGIIVRHPMGEYVKRRNVAMQKFKPKQFDYYQITGAYEAISENGDPLNMLGGFNCMGAERETFNVGPGNLTHDQRKIYWQAYMSDPRKFKENKWVLVGYQNISPKGIPRCGITVSVVDESAVPKSELY